ncbi:uncharacterized protein LOC132572350 [Heteronotia binoei]|uniref:uncharacterized protein LOC132572350 n=1 Tax=Heteronotia binoei TaxID=13085 RepID=UPI00292FEC94|nr:uncharacterized protein LOC132572350 [Heteronotia binoei]
MPLQYVKSKKGRDQLVYDGYLHTKERVVGNKTFWKCAIYYKDHCPGRAHTYDDRVIKYSAHCHPPIKAAREAKRIERSTKTTTPSVPQLTYKGVPPTSDGLSETVPAKKPCIQNPKQTMERLRACLSATLQGTCHSQTSATVAESVPAEPSSVVFVTPPDLQECSERFKDGGAMASPVLCEEPQTSHSVHLQASQEAGRQRFRSGAVPPGANPQKILSWISEAARQWLCPREHDKDQIVDMVILEQFLAVLPVSMQAWVKAREPRTSMEAVWLAETYLGDQELVMVGQELEKDLVTFEDVSLRFSEEEWTLMDQEEKALYWNVMHQNYNNVSWLSKGTGSKTGKDPWQEASEPTVELLKKSSKEISWDVEQDLIREAHLERQPKSSSVEKEDAILFLSDLEEITIDDELGLETVSVCCGCRKGEDSSAIVTCRKSPREEVAEPAVLSGELQESSEKKILREENSANAAEIKSAVSRLHPTMADIQNALRNLSGSTNDVKHQISDLEFTSQNPEETLIKEGQKDVESNNPRVEENSVPFRKALRDHQDSRPRQETFHMAIDSGDQDKSLTFLHDQNITMQDDLECAALPEGSLFISEEEIFQSPEKDSKPESVHVYSVNEPNEAYSEEGVNGTEASMNQETISSHEEISSPGTEGGEAKSVLSENGLPELTEDQPLLRSQLTSELQPAGPNPEESSEHNSCQKSSQGNDLCEGPSHKRQFIQSLASTTQPTCSDSGGNSGSLSVLTKQRRFDKKRKPCSRRNMPVRSVLGTQWRISPGGRLHKHLNWNWWASRRWESRFPEQEMGLRKHSSVNINAHSHETLQTATEEHRTTIEAASSSDIREAEPWPRAPSSFLLDKMAAEPTVAQLMAVLQQVAADTAEIKSLVSRLHPTVADIQNALRNFSGSNDDVQHRISDLEFTSQNTEAQLVQHCNDIKAIEAKLVGKAVQTNVIAGLWPSLGVKREMSP